jgi:hypothetical protein
LQSQRFIGFLRDLTVPIRRLTPRNAFEAPDVQRHNPPCDLVGCSPSTTTTGWSLATGRTVPLFDKTANRLWLGRGRRTCTRARVRFRARERISLCDRCRPIPDEASARLRVSLVPPSLTGQQLGQCIG